MAADEDAVMQSQDTMGTSQANNQVNSNDTPVPDLSPLIPEESKTTVQEPNLVANQAALTKY